MSEKTFEQAFEELDGLIKNLEHNKMPLEEMLQNYVRAHELLRFCEVKLKGAKEKIQEINEKNAQESS